MSFKPGERVKIKEIFFMGISSCFESYWKDFRVEGTVLEVDRYTCVNIMFDSKKSKYFHEYWLDYVPRQLEIFTNES